MGQESQAVQRRYVFEQYRVDDELVRLARPSAVVMHDLPAHRGEEITEDVIDGPRSVVFQQAENRLHAQKAILLWLLGKPTGEPT
jgi:ornithine carbamoyltransferase